MMKLPESKTGFYFLPNIITTAALFAGFYAVVAALKGSFEPAAVWIFIAMILDGADGRIARLTNSTSAFGAQYDSIADMVSFGIAPALVVYSWSLTHLGKPGWIAAFIFTAAVALRLARFNTQLEVADKRFFTGLPSPAGAGVLASMVWFSHHLEIHLTPQLNILVALITVLVGILMVSELRYFSFKQFNFEGKVPFVFLVVVILIIVAIAMNPPMTLFIAFSAFAVSGIVMGVRDCFKKRKI
jgi:CDP-diacylglycerol--serine O-phosphatidyltransferase